MKTLLQLLAAIALSICAIAPAHAAVTITFWSHELGNSFPHAFFTLRGAPDAGGPVIDTSFGFTAKKLSPALLFGPVAGKVDAAPRNYMAGSDAQFSVTMTDAQYTDVLALIDAWNEGQPESIYRLGDHNCVTFVKEAARLVGLIDLDRPTLMKKPRSYLKAIQLSNSDRVIIIGMHGKEYLKKITNSSSTQNSNDAIERN